MRQKLGMAAFVLLLGAVWGVGFLWFRGDLSPSAAPAKPPGAGAVPSAPGAQPASPSAEASSSPVAEPSAAPSAKPSARPSARAVAEAAERKAVAINPIAPRPKPRPLPPVTTFTMASFNLLGSSHTKGGGERAKLASGPQRMGGALAILAGHGISVVGFQEFQPDQRSAFQNRAPGWEMYPGLSMGRRAGENSVAWRRDTWEMVKPGLVSIPYFNGRERPMPYVLLRHRETGVQAYFSTFHNPADTGRFQGQQRHRNAATTREIALFNQLERTGIPQFVTGDMNERAEYFCRVTGATTLVAAAGGSNAGGCIVPKPTQIDWIFGSLGATFSNYIVDRSPTVRRTTDHPVIVATVKLDPLNFDNAYVPAGATTP